MRWLMLPVSAAPTWRRFVFDIDLSVRDRRRSAGAVAGLRPTDFIAAAPARLPVVLPRGLPRPDTAAPTDAPDHIEPLTLTEPRRVRWSRAGVSVGVPFGLSRRPPGRPVPPCAASAAGAGAARSYRPGGLIREPRKLVHVAPIYPEIARAARVEGLVILEATSTSAAWSPTRGCCVGSAARCGGALRPEQWRDTPTLLNGVPVRVLMTVTFSFSLGDLHL